MARVTKRSVKIKKRIESLENICLKITGMEFEDLVPMDNRVLEKGLGLTLEIYIKLAILDYINKKAKAGKKLTKDEAKFGLTKAEQKAMSEIKKTKAEASFDKATQTLKITVWRAPPSINQYNSFYTSDKQHHQAIWDAVIRKALSDAGIVVPKPRRTEPLYKDKVIVVAQIYRARLVDEDNNSFKQVTDSLKHGFVVVDDKPKYIRQQLCLPQIQCPGDEERIELLIQPFPDSKKFVWKIEDKTRDELLAELEEKKAKKNKK
jgi:hypothetical protein